MDRVWQECICPYTKSPLKLVRGNSSGDFESMSLLNAEDEEFPIVNGVPHFFLPGRLTESEKRAVRDYNATVGYYDAHITWLFASVFEDEHQVRNSLIDLMDMKPESRVLELAAGTGRDTRRIASRLGESGELYVQDLVPSMVDATRAMMKEIPHSCTLRYFVSSASFLPFADDFFDALYTFGAFNEFSDFSATLCEMARVVKPGGKIVFGDENVAPWLEDSEYAEIIKENNPIFRRTSLPISELPPTSRQVTVRWIIGNLFYVVELVVGTGAPLLDLDLYHSGRRGGSMRTRFYGRLEGVEPQTRERVAEAARASGKSVYEWLDQVLNRAAEEELGTPLDRGPE